MNEEKKKILRKCQNQMNIYSVLYERIPEDHLLKQIDRAIDFSFIKDLTANSYSPNRGRPACHPELLFRLCFLEKLVTIG